MRKDFISNPGNHILLLNEGRNMGQGGRHQDRTAHVSAGTDYHIGMKMLQNGPGLEETACCLHKDRKIFQCKGPFQSIGRNGSKFIAFLRNDS